MHLFSPPSPLSLGPSLLKGLDCLLGSSEFVMYPAWVQLDTFSWDIYSGPYLISFMNSDWGHPPVVHCVAVWASLFHHFQLTSDPHLVDLTKLSFSVSSPSRTLLASDRLRGSLALGFPGPSCPGVSIGEKFERPPFPQLYWFQISGLSAVHHSSSPSVDYLCPRWVPSPSLTVLPYWSYMSKWTSASIPPSFLHGTTVVILTPFTLSLPSGSILGHLPDFQVICSFGPFIGSSHNKACCLGGLFSLTSDDPGKIPAAWDVQRVRASCFLPAYLFRGSHRCD